MTTSPLAGKPAPASLLIDPAAVVRAYHARAVDPADPAQRVSFGTSGHRGSSLDGSFNEAHILATSQAVCDYRAAAGIRGPLYIGVDTHALSAPARETALEVLIANGVEVCAQAPDCQGVKGWDFTPTPAVSLAILRHNRDRGPADPGRADGIVVTPSHNPPADGGFKYNPPHGGPAGGEATSWIEKRANEYLVAGNPENQVRRMPLTRALADAHYHAFDFVAPYVADLGDILDLPAVARAGLRIGVDPMGGAAVGYWDAIAEKYGLKIDVVNRVVDPTFRFMCVDRDGKIRMDCSSPMAMAGLIHLKDRFDIAFGNDTDADRHGIVTPSVGLLNPNHYLAVAIDYLYANRPEWPRDAAVGKTVVSSGMIDRVAGRLGRKLCEVPVGFKWFVDGLLSGDYGFGGEESAGASFLRRGGGVWTTDKDGILLNLLAAEITAKTGQDPGRHYKRLAAEFGAPVYARTDARADARARRVLAKLAPEDVRATELAGEPILHKLARAPGNDAPIGGIKVVTRSGWFAARPSGTEDIYKIYAESFRDRAHLERIQVEAQALVDGALQGGAA